MNCLQTWEQGLGKPQRTVQYYTGLCSLDAIISLKEWREEENQETEEAV